MPQITINTEQMQEVGENILGTKQGNKIILVIDASTELGISASGKSTNIATTRGNVKALGATLGINIYKPVR